MKAQLVAFFILVLSCASLARGETSIIPLPRDSFRDGRLHTIKLFVANRWRSAKLLFTGSGPDREDGDEQP